MFWAQLFALQRYTVYKAFEEEERRKEDFFLGGKDILPGVNKDGAMTAVGFGEEDVASREA